MSSVISVNVGLPRDLEWQGKIVHSAIWKRPVSGRVSARKLNIDGDGQGDLAGHGGEHRAVMVYQIDSYRYWESFLQRQDFEYGQFGENLTVDGLSDREVCIGDRYRIGSAVFEVTQPRVTCYRVGIRMKDPRMPSLLVSHGRPGFYLRVIVEGEIGAGDAVIKVCEGPEHVTVAEADALLYLPGHSREGLLRALRVPALSAGWRGSFQALIAADERGGNAGLAPAISPQPAWSGFRSLRVAAIHRESVDVLSFILQSEDSSPLPSALPGQFLVFKTQGDENQDSVVRSYSISGPQSYGEYRVSVKRATGAGSRYFHDRIQAGELLQVSAPRGSFTLAASENPVVLISAGIGATPVLAMLHALAIEEANATREVWWFYGTRNGREHPFAAEVRDLVRDRAWMHTFIVYSQPAIEDELGKDYDASGHLTVAIAQQMAVPKGADFYLCGPAGFMKEITAGLEEWGVSAARIHSEVFGSGSSITPGIAAVPSRTPHPPAGAVGAGPAVSFVRSGLAVPWSSGFGSLLELAEACDVPVRWSCRTGVCHMCETGLIEGAVEYSTQPLDPPTGGNILICCSAPGSAVELDL